MLNNQKLTANRETVIKTAAMVAVAALMFGLILVFNSMIGYAADDYLYFFKYRSCCKGNSGASDGDRRYLHWHGDPL